ncbi:MAG: double-strand break repair helicase AddA [Sulfitobacter sp.]|nr:double-strand break repair helicase AddA [Sulfitobacter sp.]
MTMDDATRAQVEAARPDASTWLAANAGSGKTRVLTDRVARLLLEGVAPQHILCLTYTKAAASEMQNRLFKRLGAWAMLEDAALRSALEELGIPGDLDPVKLREARTLFALAIETPGGLKIQTIHSFCASLLRRFPLEAEVSPQFTEVEDRAADLLRAEIVDEMADGPDAALVEAVAAFHTGEDFGALTRAIVGMRDSFEAGLTRDQALTLFGQPAGLTSDDIQGMVFEGNEQTLIQGILPHLQSGKPTDQRAAAALTQIERYDLSALPVLEGLFLTGVGAKEPFTAKLGTFPTKETQAMVTNAMEDLNDLMLRVEAARDARLSLITVEKTLALHAFARRFNELYASAKARRGWLDFDDLILKARTLLSDSKMAAWVLYRIDGGIDHILVDEAQDTSPRQWDVIERLTDEFYSGLGARPDVERTLFVVGDKKQSIYSFQGADPLEFDRKAEIFKDRIEAAAKPFQRRSLDYSFRSSSAILRLVDTAFDPRRRPEFDKQTEHIAFKDALPGRIDLWPVIQKAEEDKDRDWTDPVDRLNVRHHTVILAEKIADQIKTLCEDKHYIPDDPADQGLIRRRVQPGDFLILVQRRSELFSQIIRACKAKGLPIAGADRLKVGAELAVKDLAALLSFLATSDDDLSLAVALKSPLFGWGEKPLYDLAQGRKGRLWEALRQRGEGDETVSILRDLRNQTDFLRPYDLIERILTRHRGREKLLARLGPEAEDGINALLAQALAYERTDVPSLTGFIEWMQTDDLEIKRQIDSASNQIRVMTVHGAKGLEAPIVILPDTGRRDIQIKDEIIRMDDTPVWKSNATEAPAVMAQQIEGKKAAQREERLRLLYVAMTRAEKWLIVAAAGDLSKDGSSWYQIVEETMSHINATPVGSEGVLRFEEGAWDALPILDGLRADDKTPLLEPVFEQAEPLYCLDETTRSPSDLGGAKALAGDAGEESGLAKAYGTYIHLLLERLPDVPEKERQQILPTLAHDLPEKEARRAQAEAERLLADPTIAHLFGADTLAEVPLTAHIGGFPFFGLIDRLVLTDEKIHAIDYKSNRSVPEHPTACPDGLLRQMGAYARMLSAIYPDRKIETAILWTATGTLMPLPHDLVTAALSRAPLLDGAGGPT